MEISQVYFNHPFSEIVTSGGSFLRYVYGSNCFEPRSFLTIEYQVGYDSSWDGPFICLPGDWSRVFMGSRMLSSSISGPT